ncbi:DEAD/DEAH box helicase [Promicromonospora sp. NPDC059942]|uniref:DEAD/DEAH box helicase n=1 Tax=Promicromonospora sp. NPDC059942 TaxID=3347009 RepID=UPI003649A5F4
MPLDLSKLRAQQSKKIHPRDIFGSLPNPPFKRLRLEQGEVLEAWFKRRNSRDLVIKQNTGGGKTAVGLLVAQSSVNEGVFPVAYLAPDTFLVNQVVKEAEALGLAVTTDAKSLEFRAGNKILVATFDKVVNGRTIFGLAGSADPLVLGTVIVDDAHAAIARTAEKFRIRVPSTLDDDKRPNPAYASLLALFGSDLELQNRKDALALQEGERSGPLRVPFWAWADKQTEVIKILSAQARIEDSGVDWAWPLVSDHLVTATATFTDRELEIRPLCPPIGKVPAFDQAKRRIYLTATLADDGVLVTELDANPENVRRPITPGRAADLGDRLILAPLAVNPNLVDDTVREMVRSFVDGDWDGDGTQEHDPINAVVLVPSQKASQAWEQYADHVVRVTDMKPVVDRMSREHVGLVVMINKYDGVDLPDSACRLLVLDGVPTPLTPSEMRESAALSGSAQFRATRVQRIEQGMGRGIRDAADYCAVLLLGDDLAFTQVEPSSLELFSPATHAQIDLSQQVSGQIRGEGVTAVREVLTMFLERDDEWLQVSRQAISTVEYNTEGAVSGTAVARRQAFDAAETGDFSKAAALLNSAADAVDDPREKGWLLEESATYRHMANPAQAQAAQKSAKGLNKLLLMPTAAVPYKALSANVSQARAVTNHLAMLYETGTELTLGIDAIVGGITWDPDPVMVNRAEDALRKLGEHLGFVSTRPDKELNEGPDNLWIMTATHHGVIEAKTGVTRTDQRIIKSETDQLSGAMNWHTKHYPNATTSHPLFVHPSAVPLAGAVPPAQTRVITPPDLDRFSNAVREFAREVAQDHLWQDPDAVKTALEKWFLTPNTLITKYSTRIGMSPTKQVEPNKPNNDASKSSAKKGEADQGANAAEREDEDGSMSDQPATTNAPEAVEQKSAGGRPQAGP